VGGVAQFWYSAPKLREELHPRNPPEKKARGKKLRITDSEGEEEERVSSEPKPNEARKEERVSPEPKRNESMKEEHKISDNEGPEDPQICYIRDLYEFKTDWSIVCRVNYLNKVECNTGNIAYNFMLSDKFDDEIKCVYFERPFDEEGIMLEVGQYYTFTGGTIALQKGKGNVGEGFQKEIQISFDKNATIIPR
jgi:hypothetical protein